MALEADAFLLRYVGSGTERVGGLDYQRTQLELMVLGADGSFARWERFDVEHAAAALARFETIWGAPAPSHPSAACERTPRTASSARIGNLVRLTQRR